MSAQPKLEWGRCRLEQANIYDLLQVCTRLPHDQREQYEALEGVEYDAQELAVRLAGDSGPKWAMVDRHGETLGVGGFQYLAPGVWQDWLLTTDEAWTRYPLAVTGACRQMVELLLDGEARRVQAMVLADRAKVRNWYRLIGYQHEGTLRKMGVNGEDVVIYARVKHD